MIPASTPTPKIKASYAPIPLEKESVFCEGCAGSLFFFPSLALSPHGSTQFTGLFPTYCHGWQWFYAALSFAFRKTDRLIVYKDVHY